MEISPSAIWLIVGAALIAVEVALVPGIGLLFAGLGAICVGGVLFAGWMESLSAQFILFFLATGFWAGVLWKPLKKFVRGKDSGFNDMVGATAVVFSDALEPGKIGQVKWSGTIMKCRLEPDIEGDETGGGEKIDPETEVTITGVSQGILLVRTKQPG